MSAECDKHGCDLVGHEFAEGGLHCPQCKLEARAERAESARSAYAASLADVEGYARKHHRAARYFAETLGVIARGDARERYGDGQRFIHRELAQTALDLHPEYADVVDADVE